LGYILVDFFQNLIWSPRLRWTAEVASVCQYQLQRKGDFAAAGRCGCKNNLLLLSKEINI
jgi:hypothetical protein